MSRWSHAQVAALAPDQASLAAARRLARPGPWSETGSTNLLVWGRCQGSGRTPYQVSVDLTGPAFRCSCPSRKFPCKHGLALLLLWVDGQGSVAEVATPSDQATAAWAAERAARNASRDAAAATTRQPDEAAAALRLARRLALMDAGVDDFSRWLTDLARTGTAAARQQPYGWWDQVAARLVDAQLPGLAEDVRSVGGEVAGRTDWAAALLRALGRWWTATRAWLGRDRLDDDQLGDLRAYLGWSVASESVRRRGSVRDRWLVLGAHRTDDGRLLQQRTWLRGAESGLTVQFLDFAAGGQVLPVARTVGSTLEAAVALYPGRGPRRGLFVDEPLVVATGETPPAGTPPAQVAEAFAALVAANPWAQRMPVLLDRVTVGPDPERPGRLVAAAADGTGFALTADVEPWPLLALTGGRADRLFGEYEHGRLRPLAAAVGGGLVGW
ncbi:hypothetical protein FHX74_000611 [Friedmanniella endophytica]|uniref:SWIM-type domain-containing protein n=1 Tax=Microlunatus kandeliicorticis TaxID=1759536 RepID=A0A7W3P4N6_9ACTN|nr:SWIM zinc finger family protein [Microlunatus kandeliicorticis]MBA8793017.1 hypothetical protein [Microlunatus kandeliicorticis]